jgi:hypothetical protein
MNNSAKTSSGRYKRRLRNYLIDKRFQLSWVLRVAFVATIIVVVLGFLLYKTLSESIEITSVQLLSSTMITEPAQAAIIERGEREKIFTKIVLFTSLISLVIILSILTIVVTHKTAGPVFKIRRLLAGIDGDRLQLWESLRKGDDLHEVFSEFSQMLERLRDSRYSDIELIEEVISDLESSGVPRNKYEPLIALIIKYKESIKMK